MGEEWKEYFEKRLGDFKDEIIHHFHIISEDVISKVQQVGEGVVNLNGKLDRRIDELDRKIEEKHQDVIAAIKFSYASAMIFLALCTAEEVISPDTPRLT